MTQHTPYDAEIAQREAAFFREPTERACVTLAAARNKAEGYRTAKADDAALLAAAKELDRNMGMPQTAGWARLRAAIAAAEVK